jgi:hypothetical protein
MSAIAIKLNRIAFGFAPGTAVFALCNLAAAGSVLTFVFFVVCHGFLHKF